MIGIKTEEEFDKILKSNGLVLQVLAEIAGMLSPGVTTRRLDEVAEEYIRDHRGIPGFLGYNGFPNTLCTSVNSEVVHGIPSDYALKEGDIISVDCGIILDGYYGDSAYTFPVGEIDPGKEKLLKVTQEALFQGIGQSVEGKRLGDVGYAVQKHAEDAGFSVVREMVGHGLGRKLHEEPEVPNYGKRGTGHKLKKGMVFCIEPMINMGSRNIKQDRDGWTVRTVDNMPSAHFELPVAVNGKKPMVLGDFSDIENKLNITK